MPHAICNGAADLEAAWRGFPSGPWRWGNAVARIEGCYLAPGAKALLVSGVIVEYGRPLHPVALVTHRGDETAVHLWSVAAVERTEAVKRFVARVAVELRAFGAGSVRTTNVAAYL